jgi:hypothetical protein
MLPFCHPLSAICLVSNAQLRDDFYVGDPPSSPPFFSQFQLRMFGTCSGVGLANKGSV